MAFLMLSWADLGEVLGRSWVVLSGLGAVFGGLGMVLGRSWAVLGWSWGGLGPSWGGLGLPFPPSGLVTNSPKSGATPLLPPSSLRNFTSFFFSFFNYIVLAPSWAPFWSIFGAQVGSSWAQVAS